MTCKTCACGYRKNGKYHEFGRPSVLAWCPVGAHESCCLFTTPAFQVQTTAVVTISGFVPQASAQYDTNTAHGGAFRPSHRPYSRLLALIRLLFLPANILAQHSLFPPQSPVLVRTGPCSIPLLFPPRISLHQYDRSDQIAARSAGSCTHSPLLYTSPFPNPPFPAIHAPVPCPISLPFPPYILVSRKRSQF